MLAANNAVASEANETCGSCEK